MVITAPALFSTTTFQPSLSDSAAAMMRARMSGGVLAEVGTTMRITLVGKDCAMAGRNVVPPKPSAAAPARNARRFMRIPLADGRSFAMFRSVKIRGAQEFRGLQKMLRQMLDR